MAIPDTSSHSHPAASIDTFASALPPWPPSPSFLLLFYLFRFVPIVRTFAPFVAGIGSMEWTEFTLYNVLGAVIWTASLTCLGYFFGNLPLVQHNFTLVVLGIVAVSVLPIVYEVLQSKRG